MTASTRRTPGAAAVTVAVLMPAPAPAKPAPPLSCRLRQAYGSCGQRLRDRRLQRLDECLADVGGAGDELDVRALRLERLAAQDRDRLLVDYDRPRRVVRGGGREVRHPPGDLALPLDCGRGLADRDR